MAEVLRAKGLSKAFAGTPVVKDISLSIQGGEILGLIGPNGAGKTTVIRMLLRMIQPDAGEVAVFGRPLDSDARDRIGYLPEERGLYKQTRVADVMAYMAQLKGLSRREARTRSIEVLERLGMGAHGRKKVSELSRGMRQLVQFGATVIHEPDLVILDEPFSGLDPVNTEQLKGLVSELQMRGAAVIFSTHQMNAVEELCHRVLMVHRGEAVLYGPVEEVKEVKERYRNNSLFIHWDGPRDRVTGIERWEEIRPHWEAHLADGTSPEVVLEEILRLGGSIKRFQLSSPSLNEVFIQVVQEVLEPVVKRYQENGVRLLFRADAAFAKPEVYEYLESRDTGYAMRLPANEVLQRNIRHLLKRPVGRPPKKPVVRYHDFVYQAQSWDIPRRVVAKVEWRQGVLFPRVGFVVTNLNLPPAGVTHYYNGRGTAEQWIKEGKYALNWTRLSCHRFVANQVRLWLFVLAYNLGNFMRRLTLPESVKHWSLRSVQTKLIKMGGRLVRHARRLVFQLAEVAVSREIFRQVLERIAGLHPAPG